jgi:hypothetical protein
MSARSWRLLDEDPMSGLKHWFRYIDETDSWQHKYEQPTDPSLDYNKARQNDGTNGKVAKDWWHAAHIPNIIIHKWLVEDGINFYDAKHWDRVAKKLDDPDYAYLRPSNFKIGKRSKQV